MPIQFEQFNAPPRLVGSGNFTVDTTAQIVDWGSSAVAAGTATMMPANSIDSRYEITIKNVNDFSPLTIQRAGADTINGQADITILPGGFVRLRSNGVDTFGITGISIGFRNQPEKRELLFDFRPFIIHPDDWNVRRLAETAVDLNGRRVASLVSGGNSWETGMRLARGRLGTNNGFQYPIMNANGQIDFAQLALYPTFDHTTDTFTLNGHPLQDGSKVTIRTRTSAVGTLPTGATSAVFYTVRNVTANTFQLADFDTSNIVNWSSNGSQWRISNPPFANEAGNNLIYIQGNENLPQELRELVFLSGGGIPSNDYRWYRSDLLLENEWVMEFVEDDVTYWNNPGNSNLIWEQYQGGVIPPPWGSPNSEAGMSLYITGGNISVRHAGSTDATLAAGWTYQPGNFDTGVAVAGQRLHFRIRRRADFTGGRSEFKVWINGDIVWDDDRENCVNHTGVTTAPGEYGQNQTVGKYLLPNRGTARLHSFQDYLIRA